ncbi:FtsX-like permease family protein [Gryllotalpicola reticulitermitis]|uniref:FtsX-like permease family protein n=1 Tax=Gryllotalpicola reticulitermitis TaxID=1184153 RepID=A0ABV8Q5K0_9MICO
MRPGLRGQASTLTVSVIAGTFGVALLQFTGLLSAAIRADPVAGASPHTVPMLLDLAAISFIVLALYVSGVVTSNTVATVVAGRTRQIALLRLIGSSAGAERTRIAREGLLVGILGALAGAVIGTAAAALVGRIAVAAGLFHPYSYSFAAPIIVVPVVAVALTTWLAAWVGSRRVLDVRPIEALSNSTERNMPEIAQKRGRHKLAMGLVIAGVVFLALGVVAGLKFPPAVLLGLIGGLLSFTGIVFAADRVIPPVLKVVGRVIGTSHPARIAAENALRYPERSSRMTVGLVIGVTLVTTFAVTMRTFETMLAIGARNDPQQYNGLGPIISGVVTVFSVLIGFSALIAAVGLVNTLSLSVLQRTRELGLMRALGFTRRQLGAMILAEAAALTITATVVGLVLGFVYGWIGAQSMLGGVKGHPGLVLPQIPWTTVLIVVVAAAALTLVAAFTPSRRATRISPVTALAVE